ncbi:hypothetical protein DOTSEDRAFT_22140 [Dothistroma septosporum NZE10]|uniref:Uncharacterized protein n=1 Tax=Dothistroma septosporum (strain NZE10 / CBS 128990) TaxID=675120 RepID=N1PSW1_DOTSN|nr:hypothetical protein DOTSEDRAFT_22140 [Dothistroma septosporum NZE10]
MERGLWGATPISPTIQCFSITSNSRLPGFSHHSISVMGLEEVCQFCKRAGTLARLQHLTIIVADPFMNYFLNQEVAREEKRNEKALHSLGGTVTVTWVSDAEKEREKLDASVQALERRKQEVMKAKQKRIKEQFQVHACD